MDKKTIAIAIVITLVVISFLPLIKINVKKLDIKNNAQVGEQEKRISIFSWLKDGSEQYSYS